MSGPEATLAGWLEQWRASKDPVLAQVIADYTVAHESPAAVTLRSRSKWKPADWLAALDEASPLDRGAVLAAFAHGTSGQVADRIRALAELDPDPRVVDTLHALIAAIPWTSTGARKVWTRCFALLAELGDPRTLVVARGFDPANVACDSDTAAEWMAERLTKLADAIEKLPPPTPLSPAEVEAVAAASERLAASSGPSAAAETLDALLAQSLAAPDDLDARLVLADALSEAGDPRGELIRVQVARESNPKDRKLAKLEKQLLKDHRDALLGTLETVVLKSSLVFARGFVEECTVQPQIHAPVLEAIGADPQLATIRKAKGPPGFVLLPGLTSLREVEVINVHRQTAGEVLRCARPLPWTSLRIGLEAGDPALLDGCNCLPALTELHLETDALDRALGTELVARVPRLGLTNPSVEHLDAVLDRLLVGGRATEHLALQLSSAYEDWLVVLELDRNPDGARDRWSATLRMTLPPENWGGLLARATRAITNGLAAIANHPIDAVTLRSTKKLGKTGWRERVDDIVAAQLGDASKVSWQTPD